MFWALSWCFTCITPFKIHSKMGILSPSWRSVLKITEAGSGELDFELGSARGFPELGGVSGLQLLTFSCLFGWLKGSVQNRETGQDSLTTNASAHFIHTQQEANKMILGHWSSPSQFWTAGCRLPQDLASCTMLCDWSLARSFQAGDSPEGSLYGHGCPGTHSGWSSSKISWIMDWWKEICSADGSGWLGFCELEHSCFRVTQECSKVSTSFHICSGLGDTTPALVTVISFCLFLQ